MLFYVPQSAHQNSCKTFYLHRFSVLKSVLPFTMFQGSAKRCVMAQDKTFGFAQGGRRENAEVKGGLPGFGPWHSHLLCAHAEVAKPLCALDSCISCCK